MTENILPRKAISITPQKLAEHEAEMKRGDEELFGQAEKIDRENAEVEVFYEKFPEIAEETRQLQNENFGKRQTIDANGKTFTAEEYQRENAERVRRETLQRTAQITKGSFEDYSKTEKVRHSSNVRAARKTGNQDSGGSSSDDDVDSDSSDSDPPGPGARAYSHSSSIASHSKEKLRYLNWRVSRYCWRLPWSKCGVRRRAA
jgi:hypothetical protein